MTEPNKCLCGRFEKCNYDHRCWQQHIDKGAMVVIPSEEYTAEPNKELPKEVQDEIIRLEELHGLLENEDYAKIAMKHYAPIIEAKDKQLSEKDKRITELHAEKYRQNEKYEELARLYGKTVNDLSAANTGKELLKAERSKLMGLLKEMVEDNVLQYMGTSDYLLDRVEDSKKQAWDKLCKENGIDLGGE